MYTIIELITYRSRVNLVYDYFFHCLAKTTDPRVSLQKDQSGAAHAGKKQIVLFLKYISKCTDIFQKLLSGNKCVCVVVPDAEKISRKYEVNSQCSTKFEK